MIRGVFDYPGLLFDPLQIALRSFLPDSVSLGLWALMAAFVSMWMYGRFSDQRALQEIRPLQQTASRLLAVYDGPFNGLLPLIRNNLRLSGRHLWLTLYPALVSTLPLLFILPWLSNTYGVYFPDPGTRVLVGIESYTPYDLHWRTQMMEPDIQVRGTGRWQLRWPGRAGKYDLLDDRGRELVTLPPIAPTPVLHKRQWWNVLVGNPAGYLPQNSTIETVHLGLPEQQFIVAGPLWLHGWLPAFMLYMVVFSLFFRWRWRLR